MPYPSTIGNISLQAQSTESKTAQEQVHYIDGVRADKFLTDINHWRTRSSLDPDRTVFGISYLDITDQICTCFSNVHL